MGTHQRQHRGSRRRTLRGALAWGVISAVGLTLLAAVLVPRLGGGTPYVILTGSMRPSMPPGTVVVTRPAADRTPSIGDVITYQLVSGDAAVVTHRVVAQGISADGEPVVRTRGDANTATDPGWVRPVQIRGKRWYSIPYLGYVITLITPGTRQLLQGLIEAGLLSYAAAMIVGAVRDRKAVRS